MLVIIPMLGGATIYVLYQFTGYKSEHLFPFTLISIAFSYLIDLTNPHLTSYSQYLLVGILVVKFIADLNTQRKERRTVSKAKMHKSFSITILTLSLLIASIIKPISSELHSALIVASVVSAVISIRLYLQRDSDKTYLP